MRRIGSNPPPTYSKPAAPPAPPVSRPGLFAQFMAEAERLDPTGFAEVRARNRLARLFSEADRLEVLQAAGDEIWHNLRKWGDPTQRDNHSIDCGCTYCT